MPEGITGRVTAMETGVPLVLRNCRLDDGRNVDVHLEGGKISAVAPIGAIPSTTAEIDLDGQLLLPSLVEPHCHLDKVFTDSLIGSPPGDVTLASRAWHDYRRTIDYEGVAERATTAINHLVGNGVTAIRTHVDVGRETGTGFVKLMSALRQKFRTIIDLQIVAFVDNPLTREAGQGNREILVRSLESGADIIGGAPYQNEDWKGFQRYCLELGQKHSCGVDFHSDETTDPTVFTLHHLIEQTRRISLSGSVTASHCVSLGSQDPDVIAHVAGGLADAGIAIVTLPLCNLFLQGRDRISSKPRGLAPLQQLVDYGVTVAGGGDNNQDPFNPVGRCDPLEVASLLVTAGHLTPEQAFECITSGARKVMGLPPVRIAPGFPADLLAIRARSLREAIGLASPERTVFRRGQLVCETLCSRRSTFIPS